MDAINITLLGGLGVLGGVAVYFLFTGGKKQETSPSLSSSGEISEVAVTLEELSQIWAKAQQTGEIQIKDIAPIWRETEEPKTEPVKTYVFTHKRAQQFFDEYVLQGPWFKKNSNTTEVVYQILSLLDKEGNCPSVVNASNDVEASWDSNTYSLLGKTTLLDHTLNVAIEAVNLLKADNAGHVIPDTLIAALGHDLGKLPSIKSHLYSLGEHPLAAGRVLAGIPEFKQLARKEEIDRAIKLHHKRPEGLLGQTLKKADQLARQKELEWAAEIVAQKEIETLEPEKNKETAVVPPAPAPPPSVSQSLSSGVHSSDAAWQAQADIYGEEEPVKKKKDKKGNLTRMDISSWFDAQGFLDDLKPYINRLNGRRFMAFSMPDGYVFFQAKALEEVARKQAEHAGAMDIATMSADDPTMRQVLFTVVDHLRVEHEVIARELIQDQYFGGWFSITTNAGKMKGFYTPFHAEPFGSIGKMESQKRNILKNFKKVEPLIEE